MLLRRALALQPAAGKRRALHRPGTLSVRSRPARPPADTASRERTAALSDNRTCGEEVGQDALATKALGAGLRLRPAARAWTVAAEKRRRWAAAGAAASSSRPRMSSGGAQGRWRGAIGSVCLPSEKGWD